ncbi:MAG: membrane integrity-associated transporter subunit PqiC [Acetobacteraceae bacterium]|nr:membrane integrity-associated transporter subunit PqiC [Acetobacteraceae bacterium]
MMRRRMLVAGLLPAAPAALLAGCGSTFNRPFPDKAIFTLQVPRPGPRDPARRPRPLLMRDVTAAANAEARGLVSRLAGNRQQTDFWNEFALPPARLVDDQLRRWLEASGAASAVLDPGSLGEAAIALEVSLLALYADLADAARPAAVASLSVMLLNTARRPPSLISQAMLTERAPLASADPGAIVAGMNAALASLFAEIERRVRAAMG